jgi:hypothetical protein
MLLLLLLFVADRQNQEREIDTAADIVLDIEDEA